MRGWTAAMALGAVALGGCDQVKQAVSPPPVKRQPGSWGQKIELIRFEGPGATPQVKAQMQQMFDMLSGMSVCLTPAAAARESISKNIEQLGSRGQDCDFSKQNLSGETIDFAATCKAQSGTTAKISATGKTGATAQDINMTVEGFKADGKSDGVMQMRIVSTRTGDCKPGDITPPDPPAETGKAK